MQFSLSRVEWEIRDIKLMEQSRDWTGGREVVGVGGGEDRVCVEEGGGRWG